MAKMKTNLLKLFVYPEFSVTFFVIIFAIFISILNPMFYTVSNLFNIARLLSISGLIAIGMFIVILTGGIDLSVGSILAVVGIATSQLMLKGVNILVVILFAIVFGFLLGSINGFLITYFKLPPIIATIGTMNIYRGLLIVITKGNWVTVIDEKYLILGKGNNPFYIFVVVGIIFILIMKFTKFGRYVYGLGANEEAVRFAGINITLYKILLYSITGLVCGLAALLFIGRTGGTMQPTAGSGYELQAIAIVLLGGAKIMGKEGTILGTILGTIVYGVLINGLTLMRVSVYWQMAVTGLVIILAVLNDILRSKLIIKIRAAE